MRQNNKIWGYRDEIRSLLFRAGILFGVFFVMSILNSFLGYYNLSIETKLYIIIAPTLVAASVIAVITLYHMIAIWYSRKDEQK